MIDNNKILCQTYKEKFVVFLTILICFLMCCYMVFHGAPHYNTNDDVTLNRIAVGDYGEAQSIYLVFSNICYGIFINFLYDSVSGVNWYSVFPIALSILAILTIAYMYARTGKSLVSVVVSFLFVFFFAEDVIIEVQFTHFAGFLSACGLFILYVNSFKSEKINPIISAVGVIVALVGFFFRKDAFLSVAAIIGVCCFVEFLKIIFKKISFLQILYSVSGFVVLFAMIVATSVYSHMEYQSDDGWGYWTEYNPIRASLLDYEMPDYDIYEEKYLEIGIDKLDFEMLTSWNYADQNKFSLETIKELQELQKAVKEENFNVQTAIKTAMKEILVSMNDNQAFICVIAVALLCLLRRENRWFVLPSMVILLELVYLSIKGRFIFRSYFGLWVSMALVVGQMVIDQYKEPNGKVSVLDSKQVAAVMIVIMTLVLPWMYRIHINQDEITKSIEWQLERYSWRELLATDEDSLYVHETLFSGMPSSLLALEETPKYAHNIYCLGGWTCPSPLQDYLLDKYNIREEGIMKALLNPEKPIYYVEMIGENNHERLLQYLRKEYSASANVRIVHSECGIDIYRFYDGW